MTANRTITELYQALRPLLLRDVAIAASGSRASSGGMETHALSSPWHTGTLAETQAPWAATKNEWATALATHAALPDVHHAAVTAGTLIALSGQQVGLAGGAAYQFVGTGGDTVPEWRNVNELAGNGLTATNGVLAVGVSGLGLGVGADTVTLTSSSNPGAAASILASDGSGYLSLVRLITSERLRTPLIDTVSGPLTLDPAGDVVSLAASTSVQTANYASQLTGWRATYAGEGDFRYLYTDEMHAKSFIADLEQALAGGQIISKSVAVLAVWNSAASAIGDGATAAMTFKFAIRAHGSTPDAPAPRASGPLIILAVGLLATVLAEMGAVDFRALLRRPRRRLILERSKCVVR